jgi:hypothetical protein
MIVPRVPQSSGPPPLGPTGFACPCLEACAAKYTPTWHPGVRPGELGGVEAAPHKGWPGRKPQRPLLSEPCSTGQGPCRSGGQETCAGVRSPCVQRSREAGARAGTALHMWNYLGAGGRSRGALIWPRCAGDPTLLPTGVFLLGRKVLASLPKPPQPQKRQRPFHKNSVRCPGRCHTLRQGQKGQPYTAKRRATAESLLCC